MSDNLSKEVIVSVKVDTSQAEQDVKGLKDNLNGIGDQPMDKAVKSLKQQLKEAKTAAMELQVAGKMDTKEYQEAVRTIAQLRDEQDVLNRTVQAFDPGNKFNAFVGIARTAGGAVQGVAGAMSFLGVESENAAQTMAKLQGLMAFTDTLNQLGDLQDFWKGYVLRLQQARAAQQAQTSATQGTTMATKGLGMAFKALGIGLLVSAIAYLASNWDSVKESVTKLFPALKDMSGMFDKVKQVAFGVGNVILKWVVGPVKALIQAVQGDLKEALNTMKESVDVVKNYTEGVNNEIQAQQEDAAKERLKKQIAETKNTIEVLKARGKETYALERKNLTDSLQLHKDGSDEYAAIQQEIRVLDAGHQKQLEDQQKQAHDKVIAERKASSEKIKQQLEQEAETYKKHQEELDQIIDEGIRNRAKAALNEKDKELFDINDAFNEQKKQVDAYYKEDLAILQNQLKYKVITKEQYNKAVADLDRKTEVATLALAEEKGRKELEVQFKYNKLILDFIDQSNTTAFEQQKAKLITAFDEKIAVADGKQKELLEKMKNEQVAKLETQETLRKNTVNTETTLFEVKADNQISDEDTPDARLQKLQAVYDAEKAWKEAKFQEDLAKLGSDQEAIKNLRAKHQLEVTEDERANSEARKQIAQLEADAKSAMMEQISNAANIMSDIVGKNTVAGKALAVAATTIDTYMAAQKAYQSQMALATPDAPVRATIAAASAVLQGLARVKAIVSVKVPAKGGEGGAGSAPVAAVAPQITQTMLNPDQYKVQDVRVINQENKPMKAYITQSDLEDNQEKTEFFNKLSSF